MTQGMFAIVDEQDFKKLCKWKWCAKKSAFNWYAVRGKWHGAKTQIVRMHREIMNCPSDKEVRHKNHKSLDNRRRNLLVTTKLKNILFNEEPPPEPAPF